LPVGSNLVVPAAADAVRLLFRGRRRDDDDIVT
jgi:hypothetical protein